MQVSDLKAEFLRLPSQAERVAVPNVSALGNAKFVVPAKSAQRSRLPHYSYLEERDNQITKQSILPGPNWQLLVRRGGIQPSNQKGKIYLIKD